MRLWNHAPEPAGTARRPCHRFVRRCAPDICRPRYRFTGPARNADPTPTSTPGSRVMRGDVEKLSSPQNPILKICLSTALQLLHVERGTITTTVGGELGIGRFARCPSCSFSHFIAMIF
jgi:hypothetical protein